MTGLHPQQYRKPTIALLESKPTIALLKSKPTIALLESKPTIALLESKPTIALLESKKVLKTNLFKNDHRACPFEGWVRKNICRLRTVSPLSWLAWRRVA
jgi:hypothetical protein